MPAPSAEEKSEFALPFARHLTAGFGEQFGARRPSTPGNVLKLRTGRGDTFEAGKLPHRLHPGIGIEPRKGALTLARIRDLPDDRLPRLLVKLAKLGRILIAPPLQIVVGRSTATRCRARSRPRCGRRRGSRRPSRRLPRRCTRLLAWRRLAGLFGRHHQRREIIPRAHTEPYRRIVEIVGPSH